MTESSNIGPSERLRIDRWLFAVRLFKSRSLAAEAVSGGKVHVDGERVKAARSVQPGNRVSFMRGGVLFDCTVKQVPARRGPASEAAQCYEETPESLERRQQYIEQRRAAMLAVPRPDRRPDKHERRTLRQLRGRD